MYLIGAVFLRRPLKSRASSPAPSIRVDLRVLSREPFCAVKACQCNSCLRGLHGGMPGRSLAGLSSLAPTAHEHNAPRSIAAPGSGENGTAKPADSTRTPVRSTKGVTNAIELQH